MVKRKENTGKSASEEEALKKKLLLAMQNSFNDSDEDSENENSDNEEDPEEMENGQKMEVDSGAEDGESDEAGDDDEEEEREDMDDEVEDKDDDDNEEAEDDEGLEYEQSDEDEIPALDKSVYQDNSDDEDNDEEQEPIKSSKTSEPAAKKPKLEEPEKEDSDEDGDDEVIEEPIKRVSDLKENPLKRKKNEAEKVVVKEEIKDAQITVEELPFTFYIVNLPANVATSDINEFLLENQIEFKRVFLQGKKDEIKFYIVFETNNQLERAKQTELIFKNLKNPNLTGKKIKFIKTDCYVFESLIDHCICIKNLKPETTEEELKNSFSSFGNVLSAYIVRSSKGKRLPFPFAKMFFTEVESANEALKSNTLVIRDSRVIIEKFKVQETTTAPVEVPIGPQGTPITIQECHRTLFVSNANLFTSTHDIKEYFNKFGKVDRVRGTETDLLNVTNRRSFLIVFEDEKEYLQVQSVKKFVLGGRNLTVHPMRWSSNPDIVSHMVKVDGISNETTKEQLEEKFRNFGKIAQIEILSPKKKENSIAFIFYFDKKSVDKALKLNGSKLEGKIMCVAKKEVQIKGSKNSVYIRKPKSGTITKDDVKTALEEFGKINSVFEGKMSFAVNFIQEESAQKAIKKKTIEIAGISVQIQGSTKASEKDEKKPRKFQNNEKFGLKVTGFSKDTTNEDIVNHFKECGKIVKVNIAGKSKIAFVEFATAEEQKVAFRLDQSELNGKTIHVNHIPSKKRA